MSRGEEKPLGDAGGLFPPEDGQAWIRALSQVSPENWAELLDGVPSIIWGMDAQGRYVYQNAGARERWGDCVGLTLDDMPFDEQTKRRLHESDRLALDGAIQANDEWITGPAIRCYYHTVRLPLRCQERGPCILGVSVDITSHRQALEALQDESAYASVLAAIRGVASGVSEGQSWHAFLAEVVEAYGFVMAWYGAYDGDTIRPAYWAGNVDKYLDGLVLDIAEPSNPDAQCAMSRAILDDKPFTYGDLAHDPGFKAWREYALELGYASNLALPVRIDGEIAGGLMVYASRSYAFPPERIERLSTLTEEMGRRLTARHGRCRIERDLARAREKLTRAVEDERRRVAGELHDSVSQRVVGMKMQLDAAAEALPPSAQAVVTSLASVCEDVVKELRDICRGLYPPTLESLGLASSLKYLASQYAANSGCRVGFECPKQLLTARFSRDTEIALFRIAQEAVSNALRHGAPETVSVRLDCADEQVCLVVTDDGKGFVPNAAPIGLGLSQMRARAAAVAGTLTINSKAGRTVVEAQAPITREPDTPSSVP